MLIPLLFTFNNAAAFAKNPATSDNGSGAPVTNAKAAYAMDFDTGTVILSRNENEKLPIASMTKIMTALLVLEDVEVRFSLTKTASTPSEICLKRLSWRLQTTLPSRLPNTRAAPKARSFRL